MALGAVVLTGSLQAAPLTPLKAKNKAMAFMAQKKGSAAARTLKPASWRPLSESINARNEQVYAFNAQGGGYVIVAGDDRIDNVLAYSLNGKIDASTIPAAMQSMLTSYAEQIDYMQSHGLSPHKSPTHPAIAPLMKTTWGQGMPYSAFTPSNFPTGCAATSMSQVMYYHKWPQDSTNEYVTPRNKVHLDKVLFDWDNMLLSYEENGQYTEAQIAAVARLMQVAGASVDMKYSEDLSGTYSRLLMPALINCFGYDKGIRYVFRDDNTIDQWDEMMYNELANNRPIIYNANTSWGSGHSFVCHGYDGNGKYYINWGWDGECDGYFLLSILDSEGTGTGGGGKNNRWSVHQDAIIGIQPPVEGSEPQQPGFLQIYQHLLLSDSIITRDADGNYPAVHVHTIYGNAMDATGISYALLDEDGNVASSTLYPKGMAINTISEDYGCNNTYLTLPSNIANGTYHLVCYYQHPDGGGSLLPCAGNKNIYIRVDVNDGTISLKPLPVKKLELTNPQLVINEDLIRTITFDVKSIGDEFNGNLYVVAKNHGVIEYGLMGMECVAIRAGEEQQVEIRLKDAIDADVPYMVYTDPMLHNKVYGEGDILDARFEDFDLSLTNINLENMTVTSHAIVGTIKSVNVGEAPFNRHMAVRAVNPDNEMEFYGSYITPRAVSAPVGGEAVMNNILVLFPGNVNRIRVKVFYNDYLQNPVGTTIGDFTVTDGVVAFSANGSSIAMPLTPQVIMPEGYDVLYAIGTNVPEVVPNSNPNTIYYIDDSESVKGLDNNIVLDRDGHSNRAINVYDGYNFYVFNDFLNVDTIHYYRTFKEEEVNTWANLCIPFDYFEKVTDVTTGTDWTSLLVPYKTMGLQAPNTFVLEPYEYVESFISHWHSGQFYFIYPSMVGHTFRFDLDKGAQDRIQWPLIYLGANLMMSGRTWQQERDNVYEMVGNKFVLRDHAVLPAFRAYVEAQSSLVSVDNLEAEYVLTMPTTPDPMSGTGIDEIVVNCDNIDPAWYTIDGRRLSGEPTAPGIYIHHGKKVAKR